jgi:hypothetical protein
MLAGDDTTQNISLRMGMRPQLFAFGHDLLDPLKYLGRDKWLVGVLDND